MEGIRGEGVRVRRGQGPEESGWGVMVVRVRRGQGWRSQGTEESGPEGCSGRRGHDGSNVYLCLAHTS